MTKISYDAQGREIQAPVRVGNAQVRETDAQVRVNDAPMRVNDAQVRVGKVINSPRACARGMTYAYGDVKSSKPLSDPARVRARRRLPFSQTEIAAWRELIFADGIEDPVKVAVQEAVRDFGSDADFTIWAWYANRIGINSFLELYFEQRSVMRTRALRNPASAFHSRLKRFYAAIAPRQGLPSVARSAKEGGAK